MSRIIDRQTYVKEITILTGEFHNYRDRFWQHWNKDPLGLGWEFHCASVVRQKVTFLTVSSRMHIFVKTVTVGDVVCCG